MTVALALQDPGVEHLAVEVRRYQPNVKWTERALHGQVVERADLFGVEGLWGQTRELNDLIDADAALHLRDAEALREL